MAVLNPYNYVRPQGRVSQRPLHSGGKLRAAGQKQQGRKDDKYLEQKVMTSTPQGLTLMLYEGAVKFIRQAQVFNKEKNIEKTSNAILRAEAIYAELQSTLDMDYEISKNLDELYGYMISGLTKANIKKDGALLDELLELAESFVDMWKDAMATAQVE